MIGETGSVDRHVEVVLAMPGMQPVRRVPWSQTLTAGEAVQRSGLEPSATDEQGNPVLGLNGRKITPDHKLDPGDRVEICRPLVADPRAARRALAARGLVMGAGGEVVPRDQRQVKD